MALVRLSLRRWAVLATFVVLCLFSVSVNAQNTRSTDAPAKTSQAPQSTAAKDDPPPATSDKQTDQGTTKSDPPKSDPTSANQPGKITGGGDPGNTGLPPAITITGSGQGGGGPPTDLPTISNTFVSINYPPPTVPPTRQAPFMNHSTLPDGTVFIVVGAILSAFGAAVIIWRGAVACLLHRSVNRAALEQHVANDKATFPAPPAQFYKYSDRESSASLGIGPAGAAGRGVRRTNRNPTPSALSSQTNLFFSPTAQGGPAGGANSVGNRDSARFLPSGFYATSSSSPAGGGNNNGIHGHGHSISLTNLRPESRGNQSRGLGPTPPDSPAFGARSTAGQQLGVNPGAIPPQHRGNMSTSSLNINRPPSGRAPSAYLEDLLDDNPGMFPPPSLHGGPYAQPPQARVSSERHRQMH